MAGRFLAPGVRGTSFVALGRSRQGRLFRKQILHRGSLRHPVSGSTITVDDAFLSRVVENFNNNVCDIVQVPLANAANEHVEDPDRNIGEVIGVEADESGLWAIIDARSEEHADKLGKTLLGASALMHLDYTDSTTGEQVGPTLLHVAVTNRPYVTELAGFEEILAATADGSDDEAALYVAIDDEGEESSMDLDKIKALLKDEHQIDLDGLIAGAETASEPTEEMVAAAAKKILEDAGVALSNTSSGSPTEVGEALKLELSKRDTAIDALKQTVDVLQASAVESKVDGLIAVGRILPAQRDAMVKLARQDEALFDSIVPDKPLISLSREAGVDLPDKDTGLAELSGGDLDAEIARLMGEQSDFFTSRKEG
jgi:hypothetical protein